MMLFVTDDRQHLSDLYAEVKDETFSVLIGTDYESDTHEPRSVTMLTPIYRHPED